jgi:glycogen synthase
MNDAAAQARGKTSSPGSSPKGLALPAHLSEAPERAPSNGLLIEVAWEVCNQLGGIYQVIRSKAPRMVQRWQHRYIMLGPYNHAKAALEFEERPPTAASWIGRVIDELRPQGVIARHGYWLISGRPRVILLEHHISPHELDAVKFKLYSEHGIETPPGNDLIDGVVSFAESSRKFLWAASNHWKGGHDDDAAGGNGTAGSTGRTPSPSAGRVLAHFHEWMGGLAIPMLRKEHCPVASVFTTHATQLGRTVAWNDDWFYDHLPFLDHAHEAEKFCVKTQHYAERACAHAAHVFTTVSGITGEECTQLVGRTPDISTPNGLNIEHYNVGHEFQTLHAQFKERINRFVMGHFFPSYAFDLDKTLFFFTSGRFEPKNKGFDLCIEAMARLNAELKATKSDKTVVFFIITQRNVRSLHPQVISQRGVLSELDNAVDRTLAEVREKLFRRLAAGDKIVSVSGASGVGGGGVDALITEYWKLRLRRTQAALKTDQLPMIVTHLLEDDQQDEVLNQIRNVWLFNRHDDPVKIVYHPQFISPTNPLWGIEYEQFVRGCHVGVFPSAYEPWGYTPLECLAMGVPAVTSDLAGFGRYVQDTIPSLTGGFAEGASGHGHGGIAVLKRRGRSFGEAAHNLSRALLEYCQLDRRERITLRNQVERSSWEFDWTSLAKAYDWAHDLALVRAAADVAR